MGKRQAAQAAAAPAEVAQPRLGWVYIGPTLAGMRLQEGAIFRGTRQELETAYQQAMALSPSVGRLWVASQRLPDAMRLRTDGDSWVTRARAAVLAAAGQ